MYLIIILITLILGLGAQAGINSQYKKWGSVASASGLTGYEAARRMLNANGLEDITIDHINGSLTDNYDPRSRTLHLSDSSYQSTSVAATAIACHEAGHAVQHAKGYTPLKVRNAIVPVVNFASNVWLFVLIAGIFLNMLSLVQFAVILYACVVVFQLVTLPVEFDASNRALASIEAMFPLPESQDEGCKKVLRAAAMTYVAAALGSLLQLLYFIGISRS
ncbi:MAG: zinc metallopeptidase [Coriobacteriales bacterium]|jgi:Zn-dependent membrane protease YugP